MKILVSKFFENKILQSPLLAKPALGKAFRQIGKNFFHRNPPDPPR